MKKNFLVLFLLLFWSIYGFSQSACLNENSLRALDLDWERAQLEANVEFLESLLAEDFIWIHNHASLTDDKSDVIQRATRQKETGENNTRSRKSQDVKVIILANTAVVTGTTIVDRGPSPTVYNFMRTYVEVEGKCFLLSNHTMAVPEQE
ncbi:nuclear transport factor 2 family protein [Algoriphagus namhaensis]|uniref:Nuclear transport factor 2 family protein n=1 Tax=Algoriphagus namhaensis TaxID=915353 RepID=A0ABV8ARX2_9BACT